VYPLPLGGVVKEWAGRKCPVEGCDFELCMYSVGQPQRSFPLCPNCFNNPRPEWGPIPGEDNNLSNDPDDREDELKERQIRTVAGRSFTLECPHPDGHPLIKDLTVCRDPESGGVFTMDIHFGPKWRLCGTRSPTIIHLPKAIDKITILDKCDEDTECHLMRIEYKPDTTPLEGGETKYKTCFEKDEKLRGKSQTVHGIERTQHKGGRSGRGRGRGRGGRGRGRGGRSGRGGRY
jgi:DNA topoisomerase-3